MASSVVVVASGVVASAASAVVVVESPSLGLQAAAIKVSASNVANSLHTFNRLVT
jgi:hypothetical protein